MTDPNMTPAELALHRVKFIAETIETAATVGAFSLVSLALIRRRLIPLFIVIAARGMGMDADHAPSIEIQHATPAATFLLTYCLPEHWVWEYVTWKE